MHTEMKGTNRDTGRERERDKFSAIFLHFIDMLAYGLFDNKKQNPTWKEKQSNHNEIQSSH